MCEKKEWSRSWSKSSEPARADSEGECTAIRTCPNKGGSSEEKPSDETIRTSLTDVREEVERARRLVRSLEGSPEGAFTCALGALAALERRIVALEKEPRKTVRSPEAENSSSKEEEYVLVASIKEVDEDGRLILGDRKILSARALKI